MKYMWSDSEASMTIRDVDFNDAGVYSCEVDIGKTDKQNASSELLVLGMFIKCYYRKVL